MNTLLEFMTRTKGIEYLIAIAFLFGFVAFWFLLHSRDDPRRLAAKMVPVILLMLAAGTLAFFRITAPTIETRSPPAGWKPLLDSTVLINMYGPASFDHKQHQDLVNDCALCHHFSEGKFPRCKTCHGEPFDPKDMSKPGLAHVYHLRCISCHRENELGPTDCEGCHTKAAVPPLSVAHPLTGGEKCLGCHGTPGVAGVSKIPADHAGATEGVCQLCHKPIVREAEMAIRRVPHDVEGQTECLICHGEGIAGGAKVPSDHAGRTDETCRVCHFHKEKESSDES